MSLVLILTLAGLGGAAALASWSLGQVAWYRYAGRYKLAPYPVDIVDRTVPCLGEVAAFVGEDAYHVGDTITLYVHTTSEAVATLYRLGASREPACLELPVPRTLQSHYYHRQRGVQWKSNMAIPTDTLRPGLYVLEIRQRADQRASFRVPIVLSPREPARVAVVLGTNDWHAYNAFGGISKYRNSHLNWLLRKLSRVAEYDFHVRLPDVYLPRRRPNVVTSADLDDQFDPLEPHTSRWVRSEWSVIAFLEREGIDHGVYAARDLAFSPAPASADLLIICGHNEYWAPEMLFQLEHYLERGGRVLVSAGNTMFGRVSFAGDGLLFERAPRDEAEVRRLVGTCFTPAGQESAAPFQVERPEHWVFADTDLEAHATFGTPCAHRPKTGNGSASLASGASGRFTCKIGRGSGSFTLLATGLNADGPAHMVYRDTRSGGWILNASSGTFAGSLGVCPATTQLARNVIDEALGRRALRAEKRSAWRG